MSVFDGKRKTELGVAIFYMLLVAVTFSTHTMAPKIASMAIIPLAVLMMFMRADFGRIKLVSSYPLLLIAGMTLMYIVTMTIWIVNIESRIYIMQGTRRLALQYINILVAFSAAYMFGYKVVDYTFYASCAINGLKAVQAMLSIGPAQSFKDFLFAITTGEQVGFMVLMEIHELSYTFGIFILFYLFVSNKPLKKKIYHILAALFFVVLGFKRIVFASVFLSVAVGWIIFRASDEARRRLCITTGIIVAVMSFLYIPIIRNGIFERTMAALNIETNTRTDIYNFVKDIYVFSPKFLGRGLEYVTRYLAYIKTLHLKFAGSSLNYIHNDILVRYIELGFWGFVGWLFSNCIFSQIWFQKNFGSTCGVLFCTVNLYNFINYSVGNTTVAYSVRLVAAVVFIGGIMIEYEKRHGTEGLKPHS